VAQEQHEGFFSIISNGSIFVYNVTVKGSNTASLSFKENNLKRTRVKVLNILNLQMILKIGNTIGDCMSCILIVLFVFDS
jgi:hypothetical protein